MDIHFIQGQNFDSNIYVVKGEKNTIIDTGTGLNPEKINKKVKKIIDPEDIDQIILTHEHYDHCGGVENFTKISKKKVDIIAHKKAAEKLKEGKSIFAKLLGGKMPKIQVSKKLEDQDTIKIGDQICIVIYTPGHTAGSISLYNEKEKTLFTGDTVFANGSFGRTDLPGGNRDLLKKSIEKLHSLDVKNLYPGHESIVEGDGKYHLNLSLKHSKKML
ncbi:MAG: MBL fold metallo-hydrolase [Candidatus Thermoplasmatota archaeon]